MKKNTEIKLRKMVEQVINEEDFVRSKSTRAQKTKQWLKSFLDACGVDYELVGNSLILNDDVYSVELKIMGGSNIMDK